MKTLMKTMLLASVMTSACAIAQTPAAPAATPAPAAAPAPPAPYGAPITLEAAKKAMAAAEAEARKNNWQVVIVVVDSGSHMVMLQKLDNAQHASIDIAKGKATSAVNFRRPTKALEDTIAGGGAGLRLLRVDGVMPLEGGIPIIVEGKIVGGIGVSGVLSSQDAQVARAGADALK
jgi:glc operon protein GlcG